MRGWPAYFLLPAMIGLGTPAVAGAQDSNILFTADSLEYLLAEAPFELPEVLPGMRFEGDRTKRVSLWFDEGRTGVLVKWAEAPRGGETFNNVPRYEIAAYELQKLFLSEPEFVVPPTIPRLLPLDWYRTVDEHVNPTFGDRPSVLVVLQYYLFGVTDEEVYDRERFDTDSVYARHWANTNLLTHLIDHKDENKGNLMISSIATHPRVFAVDNGVAFRSQRSDRGARWSSLQVERFPRGTVERLMTVTEEQLRRELGVLVQFELRDGQLVRVEPGENWQSSRGVREREEGVQIGLTEREISDVWRRMRSFQERVERGRVSVF